jgi:hypothetical protein
MAAGLGFKNFTSGEVLTAADVNAYLNSQTVMVFADATARTAAIASPQEGMFSYLKDTNATQYYTGSAWTNLDTTGMVNPMTTTGDTIYSSSGTTPARLGIGSTGQVLTVAAGLPSWATPASGGGMVKITSNTFSNVANVAIDGVFTSTYKNYVAVITTAAVTQSDDLQLQFRYAGPTTETAGYYGAQFAYNRLNALNTAGFANTAQATLLQTTGASTGQNALTINFSQVGNSSLTPMGYGNGIEVGANQDISNFSMWNVTARIYTGFLLKSSSTNITGSYAVYGLEA